MSSSSPSRAREQTGSAICATALTGPRAARTGIPLVTSYAQRLGKRACMGGRRALASGVSGLCFIKGQVEAHAGVNTVGMTGRGRSA